MAINIDGSALAANFKEKVTDYEKIFGLRLANGFSAQNDFQSLPIDQKITLTREILGNVTQPGRTGNINNVTGKVLDFKQRKAELQPAKVDLYMDEAQLFQLRTMFLANKQPADVGDINSVAGRDYIMSRVMMQIGKEMNAAVFRGVLGFGADLTNAATIASSAFQGGLNLMDGFGLKFTQGYATSGAGFVGDIPGAQKVGGSVTITEANILAEIAKIEDIIFSEGNFDEFEYDDDPEAAACAIYMPSSYHKCMLGALDNLTYKADKLVEMGEDGNYQLKKLKRVKLLKRRWLTGVDNMFFASADNMFYLHQNSEVDVPKIKFQELGRGVQILIDWETAFDYADGRKFILYK
jgi:hypothetical protein